MSNIQNTANVKSFIKVRHQFEGYHCYPGAGDIDPRIQFLENRHRHMFHVSVKISVTDDNRELEFFLVKYALSDFLIEKEMNNKSCEMMCNDILFDHLIPRYGNDRYYEVTVSEDNESDGIVEYHPES